MAVVDLQCGVVDSEALVEHLFEFAADRMAVVTQWNVRAQSAGKPEETSQTTTSHQPNTKDSPNKRESPNDPVSTEAGGTPNCVSVKTKTRSKKSSSGETRVALGATSLQVPVAGISTFE